MPRLMKQLISLLALCLPLAATAQHHQHQPAPTAQPAPDTTRRARPQPQNHAEHGQPAANPHAGHQMPGMAADTSRRDPHAGHNMQGTHDMGGADGMSHAYSRRLPMSRNGSGTAW